MNRSKRPKATTRRVTRLHAITVARRLHRSPRRLLAAMRLEYADKLTEQREAFRNERRQQRADQRATEDVGVPAGAMLVPEVLLSDPITERQRMADRLERYRPEMDISDRWYAR